MFAASFLCARYDASKYSNANLRAMAVEPMSSFSPMQVRAVATVF